MPKEKIKLFCAIWSPTNKNGQLLKNDLINHLRFLQEKGIDGLVIGGSTGEFLHLDFSVRKEILTLLSENRGSLELIFNISDPNPRVVEEFIHFSNSFDLAGVILLPPLFYPINPPDMTEYFIFMGSKSKHPFYLYNFPERAGVRIELETVQAVSEKIPVAGIKQSGGDFGYLISLIELAKKRHFSVFSGLDTWTVEALLVGANGCMGGLVNVIPEAFISIIKAFQDKNTPELTELGSKLKELKKVIDNRLAFPLNVAAFMEARGFHPGAPKRPLSESTALLYDKTVGDLRSLLQNWQLL